MLEKVPEKFSVKWFGVYILLLFASGVSMLVAAGMAGIIAGHEVFEFNMLFLFFFVAVANLIVCLIGFLNGRHIFVLSTLAVLIGAFTSVLLVTEDYNGWEYFSAVMSLALYSLFGIGIGAIVEIVHFIKNKRKIKKNQDDSTEKKTIKWSITLVIAYVILLMIPAVTILSMIEPTANKSESVPDTEWISSSFSINYSEGNNEYLVEIAVAEDQTYIYTECYLDIDGNGELYKSIHEQKERLLTEMEYIRLIDYIFYEAQFTELANDLSTKENILDAPAAFIEVKYDGAVYKKGGYYPFENERFSSIKQYLISLGNEV